MEAQKILTPFYDLENKGVKQTRFFFLEHVLKARADLKMESGRHDFDQEVNVYIAGLLHSLIESDSFVRQKPYISAFDVDIREYLENHPGTRNEYTVYRDNADFGLILSGLFFGYEHQGSYQHLVLPGDEHGKVALYYELAARALIHLQGKHNSLVSVFLGLSENMPEIILILRQAAGSYFELIERLSDGSMFHLEKDLDKMDRKNMYSEKLDDFLKIYKAYKENPRVDIKEKLLSMAGELNKLNENFRFEEKL